MKLFILAAFLVLPLSAHASFDWDSYHRALKILADGDIVVSKDVRLGIEKVWAPGTSEQIKASHLRLRVNSIVSDDPRFSALKFHEEDENFADFVASSRPPMVDVQQKIVEDFLKKFSGADSIDATITVRDHLLPAFGNGTQAVVRVLSVTIRGWEGFKFIFDDMFQTAQSKNFQMKPYIPILPDSEIVSIAKPEIKLLPAPTKMQMTLLGTGDADRNGELTVITSGDKAVILKKNGDYEIFSLETGERLLADHASAHSPLAPPADSIGVESTLRKPRKATQKLELSENDHWVLMTNPYEYFARRREKRKSCDAVLSAKP